MRPFRLFVSVTLLLTLASPAQAAEAGQHDLKITGTAPTNYLRASVNNVRWGREIFFVVTTTETAGQPPEIAAGHLPRGADFQPSTREFHWTPGQDQIGGHSVELWLVGEEGKPKGRRTIHFEVGNNHPPQMTIPSPMMYRAGETVTISPHLNDPDGDPLSCTVKGLPSDATITDHEHCQVEWLTTEDSNHADLEFSVTDGQSTTTRTVKIRLEENWESYLLPGVYYGIYRPVDHATYGLLHGTTIELVIGSWVHRNDNHGPSHGRVSLKVDLLSSTRESQPVAFFYALGVDLSVERNPVRHYLLPFFGADIGGLTQRNMHHRFQVTPRVGVYLWTTRNAFVTLAGGYMLVPGQIETLRGWRANLGLNLTLW